MHNFETLSFANSTIPIRIATGPLPKVYLICSLILTYFYPLTREMHAQIVLKLKERQNN
jgi:GPH family glycoside/pentoside/hexuronide:cation symporter